MAEGRIRRFSRCPHVSSVQSPSAPHRGGGRRRSRRHRPLRAGGGRGDVHGHEPGRFRAGPPREALTDANTNGGTDDVIVFAAGLSGTITLQDELPIFEGGGVEIQGPGASQVSISGNDLYQIFHIYNSENERVSISGLTLRDGSAANGGAIYNEVGGGTSSADLTLSELVVVDSTASNRGGGVYSADGDLSIVNSTFSGNEADSGSGGAVYAEEGALSITGATFTDNAADFRGGAVYAREAEGAPAVVIRDSVFSANRTTDDDGGAAYITGTVGDIVIERTSWTANHAGEDAGSFAVNSDSGSLLVADSTVAGNDADAIGGGFWVLGIAGPADVRNVDRHRELRPLHGRDSVLQRRQRPAAGFQLDDRRQHLDQGRLLGGGIHLYGSDTEPGRPTAIISSSIVAGNTSGPGTGPDIDGGDPLDEPSSFTIGFSLIGSTTVTEEATVTEAPAGSNLIGVDPQLGPLQNNGGPTLTHAPALTSPVIDKGVGNGLATDQRGAARTFDAANFANAAGGDGTDIGAVELLPGRQAGPASCKGKTENVLFAPGSPIVGSGAKDVIVGTPPRTDPPARSTTRSAAARTPSVKAGAGKDNVASSGQGGSARRQRQAPGNAGKRHAQGRRRQATP